MSFISKASASVFFKNLFANITTVPAILDKPFYPSLNGFRAISIIMVLFFHLGIFGDLPVFIKNNILFHYLFNGRLGVDIFFVISGFLITTLCLKERATTAAINTRQFYIRRALRILPVNYLYLLLIACLNTLFNLGQSNLYLAAAALYMVNFSYFRSMTSDYTGHFWSLALEEQFYLLFPFLLNKSFKAYLAVLLVVVFILPIILWIQSNSAVLNSGVPYFITHYLIKFQGIAVGSLLSVLTFKCFVTPIGSSALKSVLNLVALVSIILLQYQDYFSVQAMFTNLVISILIAFLIWNNIDASGDVFFRLLNSKVMNTIGILSYSIYIWHMFFIARNPIILPILNLFPYNLLCIFVVSLASYWLFERYFLKLKKRTTKAGNALLN